MLQPARWIATHVLAVALVLLWWKLPDLWHWWRERRRPAPPELRAVIDYPEQWFTEVCEFAQIHPIPRVLRHYPTEDGHAFYVLATHNIGLEGRPMTVQSFVEMGALLKDSAGIGCTSCSPEPDAQNGGRAVVYFNGVRFEGWEMPEPEPEPIRCVMVGCDKPAAEHVLVDDGAYWSIMCAGHLIAYSDRISHGHSVTEHCDGADCWHDYADPTTELAPELPDEDATDRKWDPPIGPAMDPHLREAVAGEGSEVAYPPGTEPGSTGAAVFDVLRAADGPLRRGSIASAAGWSPTTVGDHLASWLACGAVEKVGTLWVASPQYRVSGNIPTHGEEDDRG